MLTPAGLGNVTKRERGNVQHVFKKRTLVTDPAEKLMLELLMNLPEEVRKETPEVRAVIVAKLIKPLKAKLSPCGSEQKFYEGAQKFLPSAEGTAWSK